jgi:hypothetical protein
MDRNSQKMTSGHQGPRLANTAYDPLTNENGNIVYSDGSSSSGEESEPVRARQFRQNVENASLQCSVVKPPRSMSTNNSLKFYCQYLGLEFADKERFLDAVRKFKDVPEYRTLPVTGTASQFHECVDEFLRRYGRAYWGIAKARRHVYPRDIEA